MKILAIKDQRFLIRDLAVFYLAGVACHLFPPFRPYLAILTPITLFIIGLYIFANLIDNQEQRPAFIVFFTATWLFTFFIEAFGIATGVIFGRYQYGAGLGFKLLGVPPVIGLNWVLVILGSIIIVEKVFHRRSITLVLAPLVAVLFDIVLEPNARFFDYWKWSDGVVPLQNYLAWGGVSLMFTGFYLALRIKIESWVPAFNLIFQFGFFVILLLYSVFTGEVNVQLF